MSFGGSMKKKAVLTMLMVLAGCIEVAAQPDIWEAAQGRRARVMQAMDDGTRADLYVEAQQRIMDEAVIIPIRDWVNLNAASARVKGLRYDSQGWFPWLYDVQVEE